MNSINEEGFNSWLDDMLKDVNDADWEEEQLVMMLDDVKEGVMSLT